MCCLLSLLYEICAFLLYNTLYTTILLIVSYEDSIQSICRCSNNYTYILTRTFKK